MERKENTNEQIHCKHTLLGDDTRGRCLRLTLAGGVERGS